MIANVDTTGYRPRHGTINGSVDDVISGLCQPAREIAIRGKFREDLEILKAIESENLNCFLFLVLFCFVFSRRWSTMFGS